MSPSSGEDPTIGAGTSDQQNRVSFDRLRERTDELELIISGLSLLALLSIPGALWSLYGEYFGRLSFELTAVSAVLVPLITAICNAMVLLLVLHLAVRAHWVGLIGLKSVFPDGIRWQRLEGLGPLTVERLRTRVGSLEQSIARADRAASTLFSLITFTALALVVLGFWIAVLFTVAGLFGSQLGGLNTFLNRAGVLLFFAYLAVPLLRWLLDGVLLRRVPRLASVPLLRVLVRSVGFVESLFLPPRLFGITRLTLQSQLLPRGFLAAYLCAVILIYMVNFMATARARVFDPFGSQQFISTQATGAGLRSSHFESSRTPQDRLRPVPLIPSPVIETAWLPLFLPYVALRDDAILTRRCPPLTEPPPPSARSNANDSDAEANERDSATDRAGAATSACFRTLWEVSLDGVPQSLDGFVPSERGDLGLRGLTGWIPLNGAAPGPRRLEVIWRPRPEQDTLVEDYVPKRIRHVIPFLWAPEAAAEPASGG